MPSRPSSDPNALTWSATFRPDWDIGIGNTRLGVLARQGFQATRESGVALLMDRGKAYIILQASQSMLRLSVGQNTNREGDVVAYIEVTDGGFSFRRTPVEPETRHAPLPLELCLTTNRAELKIREVK